MWLSRLPLVFMFQISRSDAVLQVSLENSYSLAKECVKRIIDVRHKHNSLTFIDFNAKNLDILQAIHETNCVSIISRRPYKKIELAHRGYLIYALTAEDFLAHFWYLAAEREWRPEAPFLVVVQQHPLRAHLHQLFRELLRLHVRDVLVLDALTTQIYTYDPYRNHGCGKRFDKLIELGECSFSSLPDVFSNECDYCLRNCTLRVAATNWPPFTVDPAKNNIKTVGMDEYILSVMGELEHFTVNISYIEELSDVVSYVSEDMVASGPLRWLQQGRFDVVTGSQVLLAPRAAAFPYFYSHLPFDDYFALFVRESGLLPGYKLLLLVFKPTVWLLLLVTIITISILIIAVGKTKDKCGVIFCLLDNLFMHTCRIRRTGRIQFILCNWIVFASLIAYHYLSVLYSLTTKPMRDHQLADLSDLTARGLRPCISDAVLTMQTMTSTNITPGETYTSRAVRPCATLSGSLRSVAESQDTFTVVPYYMYYTMRYNYYDKYGRSPLYSFRKSLGKIIYGSFLYKGFPLREKMNVLATRLTAAGLTIKIWQDYLTLQTKLLQKREILRKEPFSHMIVPWYIIVLGSAVSIICLLGEIVTHRYKKRLPIKQSK